MLQSVGPSLVPIPRLLVVVCYRRAGPSLVPGGRLAGHLQHRQHHHYLERRQAARLLLNEHCFLLHTVLISGAFFNFF